MRAISAELQAHLDQQATTTCRLLKITLVDGTVFGLTSLNENITYDDLSAAPIVKEVIYYAENGFDPSSISTDIGLSVDNAEGRVLLSADVEGITEEMVDAGALDDAEWVMYLVNYNDLTMGHLTLDAGDIGQVKLVDGVVFLPELLSYTMRLRQPIGGVWSIACRAIFGTGQEDTSGILDGQTSCGVDAEALWVPGVVTGLDEDSSGDPNETRRVFADYTLFDSSGIALDTSGTDAFIPGRVQWLTGNNAADRLYQIEYIDEYTGTIELIETTPYEIEVGDTFQLRPDCDKLAATCKAYDNFLNFRGEPLIPVADSVAAMTPGAEIE